LLYVEHLFLCSNAVDGMHIFKRVGRQTLSPAPYFIGLKCIPKVSKKESRIQASLSASQLIWLQKVLSSILKCIQFIAF